jgi:hypothetical protein
MTQNVLDDWEDWEDFDVSNTVINKTFNKIIEERKLVEEADNELTKSLFSDSKSTKQELNCEESLCNTNISKKSTPTFKKEPKIGNREVLEKKQKELSSKIKLNKQSQMKQKEIFGECYDDDYIKYCDIEIKYLD